MAQSPSSDPRKKSGANVLFDLCADFFKEFARNIKTRRLPWRICCGFSVTFAFLLRSRLDALAWKKLHIAWLYPFNTYFYWSYVTVVLISPFFIWGVYRLGLRKRLVRRLTTVFHDAGLQTRTGRLPGFIADEEMDIHLRKLIVSSVGLPKSEFEKAKDFLASALQVHIDDIRCDLSRGKVEILYAHHPISDHIDFTLEDSALPLQFKVGHTRSKPLCVCLKDVPHILVGGYTNSGKSTFLRQALVTLILKNRGVEFSLIDLKGGLEFQPFRGLPGVQVYPNTTEAIQVLKRVESQLEKRMELLAANRANDLDAYFKVPEGKRVYTKDWPKEKKLNRHVIAIDEAAELFLAGATLAAKDAQIARRLTSRIAALGRAIGIHLIIATQRPDRSAVDPLIKTNLQGRLCFQMADNASSMTILDSVRAADLPPIKGRAIWRSGMDLIEVQVPWLSRDATEEIIAPERSSQTQSLAPNSGEAGDSPAEQHTETEDEIAMRDQKRMALNPTNTEKQT